MLHIACDVHTHTIFSRHAYSTIEENVRAAAEMRVELLGSTDHFSAMVHPAIDGEYDLRDFQHFLNVHSWPRIWNGVRLLHGVEADIVDVDGHLFGHGIVCGHDITGRALRRPINLKERVFDECDYVIASVHDRSWAEGASLALTSECYVRALEDPKVLILGHTGRSSMPYDLGEVLTVAKERGKLIEINEATFGDHPSARQSCRRIAERCAEMGVMISTGTDAHISYGIGRFDHVRSMLEEIRFPQKLVATRDAQTFLDVLGRAIGRPDGL